MNRKDVFGDRMKSYESLRTQYLMPNLPIMIRLDGKCFHSYCRGLSGGKKPYDARLMGLMQDTMVIVAKEANATCAYTQSDEITLALIPKPYDPVTRKVSELFFNGRVSKIESTIAGLASAYFSTQAVYRIPERANRLAVFDCRAWNVPSIEEAANTILWREMDATKNSIQMLTRANFSQKEMYGKGQAAMHEMLYTKGINWNDEIAAFKRGSFCIDGVVSSLPSLRSITNRAQVLFEGAAPTSQCSVKESVPTTDNTH